AGSFHHASIVAGRGIRWEGEGMGGRGSCRAAILFPGCCPTAGCQIARQEPRPPIPSLSHLMPSRSPKSCTDDIVSLMQLIDEPLISDPAAAERLYRSLCRFRREMLREGMLGAIRSGDDMDLSLIQLGVLLLLDAEGERTIKAVAEELGRSLSATS